MLRFTSSSDKIFGEVVSSVVYGCLSAYRRMVLYSTTANMEQSFLPSLTDDSGEKSKQDVNVSVKKKRSRQKNKNDDGVFVSFPEVANTIKVTAKASISFARKSSSLKTSFQTEESPKNTHSVAKTDSYFNKYRGRKLRLPPLTISPLSDKIASEKRWSAVLGLRDSYEMPRAVLDKLTDDIRKIDKQMKEEVKMRQIRQKRMCYKSSTQELSSSKTSGDDRTSRPGFSYFPSLTTSAVKESPGFDDVFIKEDHTRTRMSLEEEIIQRKMKEFKNRHSHFNLSNY